MRLEAGLVRVTGAPGEDGRAGGDVGRSGGPGEGVELASPAGERTHPVDAEDGDRLATPAVHGKEAALGDVAVLDRELVGEVGRTGELDARAVLVGPEVGRPGGRDRRAATEQRGHSRSRALERTGPVLDPPVPPGQRVV